MNTIKSCDLFLLSGERLEELLNEKEFILERVPSSFVASCEVDKDLYNLDDPVYLMEPVILTRASKGDKWRVLDGHRRVQIAKNGGDEEIPAWIPLRRFTLTFNNNGSVGYLKDCYIYKGKLISGSVIIGSERLIGDRYFY